MQASDNRAKRRTLNTATSNNSAEPSKRNMGATDLANTAVRLEPRMPPSVAPAAIKPNSRLLCSESKTSTINAQNTETTNKLNTEVQMKKNRPIQMCVAPVDRPKSRAKMRMLAIKKR